MPEQPASATRGAVQHIASTACPCRLYVESYGAAADDAAMTKRLYPTERERRESREFESRHRTSAPRPRCAVCRGTDLRTLHMLRPGEVARLGREALCWDCRSVVAVER